MHKAIKTLYLFLAICILYSCISLEHVNEYSSNALDGLKKFEQLGLDFESLCMQSCRIDKIDSLSLEVNDCMCRIDKKADSVTNILYLYLKVYFIGLSSLSNNELTTYKLDELSGAIADSTHKYKAEIEAASEISGIVLKAVTNEYRKNKIREYLKEANEPVGILLQYLDNNLSEYLTDNIGNYKQKLKLHYFEIIHDNNISDIDKKSNLQDYYTELEKIKAYEDEINTYSSLLQKIKQGHQQLAEYVDQLKADEVQKVLHQYANDIDFIIAEYNKIKTD